MSLKLVNIIGTNVAAIMLLLLVLQNMCHSVDAIIIKNKKYYLLLSTIIAQAANVILNYSIEELDYFGSHFCAVVINALYFIGGALVNLCAAIFLISYIRHEQITKTQYACVIAPTVLIEIGAIVNLFTPVYFYVEPETLTYVRTDLCYAYNVLMILYFISIFVVYLVENRENRFKHSLPIVLFLLPTVGAVVTESVFMGTSFAMLGAAIGVTAAYFNIQSLYCSVDTLSGLLTHQQLLGKLEKKLRYGNGDETITGLMIDIDNFKFINDTYGHLEGDRAIQAMGSIISNCTNKHSFGFRYAGDEFVMLFFGDESPNPNIAIDTLMKEAERYFERYSDIHPFTFTAGFAVFDRKNDTVKSFIAKIDEAMYYNKTKATRNKTEK